ncbi:MAG TPA: carboxypeptidase regulatory-like domain-containing protein [Candidatus Udaeobacter sp.]|jgi:plastocyanin
MKQIFGWLITGIMAGGMFGGLAGCKSSAPVQNSQEPAKANPQPASLQPAAPLDPATLGAVSGTVHFSGNAPERIRIDMSQDPVCSMAGGDNFAEQYVVHDGKLANVYVYVKDGPAAAMSAPAATTAPVVLDQVGCRYVPHVIAVMRGGSVEFRNSDGTMHNIHTMPSVTANKEIDISQGSKGAPQVREFPQPEVMMPVRCNNHPWMNAFINVSATSFFAVTDANGHFDIRGLPAGSYTLAVVHEKMGEQTMTLTIKPHATETANFTYSIKK